MAKHLVFYDGQCGLCDHTVKFIIQHDPQEKFIFASLQGETAKKMLKSLPDKAKHADSIILIEDYQSLNPKIFLYGKAVFRILWYLGGVWALPGLLSWAPSFLYDWGYRLVAKNRKSLFCKVKVELPTPETKHRFLP